MGREGLWGNFRGTLIQVDEIAGIIRTRKYCGNTAGELSRGPRGAPSLYILNII